MTQDMPSSSARPPRTRVVVQYLFLFALLVAAPVISWLYLRTGLDYRKEHLAKLSDYGEVAPMRLLTADQEEVFTGDWNGVMHVITIASTTGNYQQQVKALEPIHSQFDDQPNIKFWSILTDSLSVPAPSPDTAQWRLVTGPKEPVQALSDRLKGLAGEMSAEEQLFFVDQRRTIRLITPIADRDSVVNLVETMAVLIPPRKLSKPELKRESEK